MATLEIKIEKYPQRCEICHQSDKYDPIANLCGRCKQVNIGNKNLVDVIFSNVTSMMNKYFVINWINGYLAAYLFGFIATYPGFELFFFYRQEKFLVPNWKYFLCAAMIIPLGLFVSLLINRHSNNIDVFRHRIACYVFLPISIFITGTVGVKFLFLAAGVFPFFSIIFPFLMIGIIEALILRFVTNRWYWHLFILMPSSIFIAYLLAFIDFKITGQGNHLLFFCAFLNAFYFQWVNVSSTEKNCLQKRA